MALPSKAPPARGRRKHTKRDSSRAGGAGQAGEIA